MPAPSNVTISPGARFLETGASKFDGEGHADIPQSHHANMSGVSIFSFSS